MTARPWQGPGPNPMSGAGGRRRVPQPPGKGPGGAVSRAAPGLQRGIQSRFNAAAGRPPVVGAQPQGPARGQMQQFMNKVRPAPGQGPMRGPAPAMTGQARSAVTAFGQAAGRPGAAPRGPMKMAAPLRRQPVATRRPAARSRPPARNRGRGGPGPWG